MSTIVRTVSQFVNGEEGLVAAEYAILLGLIAVALLTAITTFRTAIENAFSNASNSLAS